MPMSAPHGGGGSRLRSFLRHERMTVRMELAAALHHSSFRGAGPVTYDAPRSQRTANSRVDSVLFDLFDEDTEGARPDRIATLSGPQARVQRRTVEQIVDLFSTILCRRWWNSCQTSCASSTRFCLFLSRLSKCPRSWGWGWRRRAVLGRGC